MKHLVIAVSPDSSLELLGAYADVIVLDKNPNLVINTAYETVYIRSHFAKPSTLPQVFKTEIETIVSQVRELNLQVRFIDAMDTVESIVKFEDKWHQYELFSATMPHTELFNSGSEESNFTVPIYKNRLSSRGRGVTWDKNEALDSDGNWIIQESLDIAEELRVYALFNEIYPVAAVRQSKTDTQGVKVIDSRELGEDELLFAKKVSECAPHLDIIGLDIVRTTEGRLFLLEVNRSPGFAKFQDVTDVNLADILYQD